MDETTNSQFSESVTQQLVSDETARQLWIPVAQEFQRAGPESAKEYLVGEQQRLEARIKRLIEALKRE